MIIIFGLECPPPATFWRLHLSQTLPSPVLFICTRPSAAAVVAAAVDPLCPRQRLWDTFTDGGFRGPCTRPCTYFGAIRPTRAQGKVKHFGEIRRNSRVPYEEMIFFDDWDQNCKDVGKLGVTCVECRRVRGRFCV